MSLRPMRIHDITHSDAYSLSSLKERGLLDISKVRVFPINRTLWRNPNPKRKEVTLAHISQESVKGCS